MGLTKEEWRNDPEMVTIVLLSGYVRELGEGKDYMTTTLELAEKLVKVFSKNQRIKNRELLLGLLNELENGGSNSFPDKETIVDEYLKSD